jgi:hypothetical protein
MGSEAIDRAIRDGLSAWDRDDLDRVAWRIQTRTELFESQLAATEWCGTALSCGYQYRFKTHSNLKVRLPSGVLKTLTIPPSVPLTV